MTPAYRGMAVSFLSTLSLRRATCTSSSWAFKLAISIHALLAESDLYQTRATPKPSPNFYPRSPCGERPYGKNLVDLNQEISIHALLAESDGWISAAALPTQISIHALLAESDFHILASVAVALSFLSTLSLRRATLGCSVADLFNTISIHALLAESDRLHLLRHAERGYFYPRSPCGERPVNVHGHKRAAQFLSTLSLRRATRCHLPGGRVLQISIHALLAESDPRTPCRPAHTPDFYPRSPCGERPNSVPLSKVMLLFLSTLSLRRATRRAGKR